MTLSPSNNLIAIIVLLFIITIIALVGGICPSSASPQSPNGSYGPVVMMKSGSGSSRRGSGGVVLTPASSTQKNEFKARSSETTTSSATILRYPHPSSKGQEYKHFSLDDLAVTTKPPHEKLNADVGPLRHSGSVLSLGGVLLDPLSSSSSLHGHGGGGHYDRMHKSHVRGSEGKKLIDHGHAKKADVQSHASHAKKDFEEGGVKKGESHKTSFESGGKSGAEKSHHDKAVYAHDKGHGYVKEWSWDKQKAFKESKGHKKEFDSEYDKGHKAGASHLTSDHASGSSSAAAKGHKEHIASKGHTKKVDVYHEKDIGKHEIDKKAHHHKKKDHHGYDDHHQGHKKKKILNLFKKGHHHDDDHYDDDHHHYGKKKHHNGHGGHKKYKKKGSHPRRYHSSSGSGGGGRSRGGYEYDADHDDDGPEHHHSHHKDEVTHHYDHEADPKEVVDEIVDSLGLETPLDHLDSPYTSPPLGLSSGPSVASIPRLEVPNGGSGGVTGLEEPILIRGDGSILGIDNVRHPVTIEPLHRPNVSGRSRAITTTTTTTHANVPLLNESHGHHDHRRRPSHRSDIGGGMATRKEVTTTKEVDIFSKKPFYHPKITPYITA